MELIAFPADPAEALTAACRALLWREPQPRRKVPTGFKLGWVDSRHEGERADRAYAWLACQTFARGGCAVLRHQPFVERAELLVEAGNFAAERWPQPTPIPTRFRRPQTRVADMA